MTPTAFTWPYWLALAAVVIWAYIPEFKIVRSARTAIKRGNSRDAGSFQVIIYAGGLASMIAVALAWIPLWHMSGAVRLIALLAVVGAPYREFISTRRRLIPFLY